MTRRLALAATLLLLCVPPLYAKRRAVTPGAPGHCITGRVAEEAFVVRMVGDATHVYWIDDAAFLMRAPRFGGAVEELARLDDWLYLSMTVDDANVYVGAWPIDVLFEPKPGAILTVPKSGGSVAVHISGIQTPFDVEVDATHLYWADVGTFDLRDGTLAANGKIERALKNGSQRQTLAENLSAPADLLLDGDTVWFGETGLAEGDDTVGLFRVARSGGAVTTVTADIAAAQLTLAGDSLVVYGGSAASDNALFVIAKNGASVRTLVEDDAIFGQPRVADGRVYYLTEGEETNALWSVPLAGGTPTRLRNDLYFAEDFLVDGCAIVLATAEGDLLRVAK